MRTPRCATEAKAVHKGGTYPDGTAIGEIPQGTNGKALYRESAPARRDRAVPVGWRHPQRVLRARHHRGARGASAPGDRRRAERQAGRRRIASYLRQFHYLSTVSGGGYIGSWLSAWIARAGYAHVWSELIGRRAHPEQEPSEIAWLRAYSNYLTPRAGLLSADTWAAIALYVRNLMLNWLVILPALCLVLLGIKTIAILAFWLVGAARSCPARLRPGRRCS